MQRPTKKQLDQMWSYAVKARAGFVSEWSGKTDRLNSHHIAGKPNYAMRWDLDNGVCITSGEHKFIAHHSGRSQDFRKWALKLRGIDEDYITLRSKKTPKPDEWTMYIYLKNMIKKFESKEIIYGKCRSLY